MPRLILAACLGLFLLPATVTLAEDAPKLETPEQRASYAIGQQIGDNMKKQGLDFIDDAALISGVRDALDGADKKLTEEEITKAFQVLVDKVYTNLPMLRGVSYSEADIVKAALSADA